MQSLFAFQQCKDADYQLCLDRIEEAFAPDLNSMEVQDKQELTRLKNAAIRLFEEAFAKSQHLVEHEEKKVATTVNDAFSFFEKTVKKDFDFFKKNLVLDAEKIYDRYIAVLSLATYLADAAAADKKINHNNFIRNEWIKALKASDVLQKESLKVSVPWKDHYDRVRVWMRDVVRQDADYLDYLDKKAPTVEDQKKIMNHIFRKLVLGKTPINDFFEEEVLRWSEDREIVKGMVEKTVKSFDPTQKEPLQLHALSLNWDDDRNFIETLFSEGANLEEEYRNLIANNTRNWEVDRLALTDRVILEMAIAELISFPNIPVKVTINEYIELAKNYSTPKSRQFINGILDVISKELKTTGAMKKSGRGLIDNK